MRGFAGLAAAVLLAAAACGTTEPDCVDPYNRGPVYELRVTCSPDGDGVRCEAKRTAGYPGYGCAEGLGDVTAATTWTSSDPSIGEITGPGRLRTLQPGLVQIIAKHKTDLNYGVNFWAYSVAPGTTPERLVLVQASARTTTGANLLDVAVDFFPERGLVKNCVTDQTGRCDGWVLNTSLRLVARKVGFEDTEATLTPTPPADLSFFRIVTLTMSPTAPASAAGK